MTTEAAARVAAAGWVGAARAEAAMAAWAAAARDREGAWEGGGSDRGVGCDGCFVRDARRVGVRHEQSEPEHGRLHAYIPLSRRRRIATPLQTSMNLRFGSFTDLVIEKKIRATALCAGL